MGKSSAKLFDEDDYFADPDYDNFTDEELDELYNFGQLEKGSSGSNHSEKPLLTSVHDEHRHEDFEEIELDLDDYMDSELYDEEEPTGQYPVS